MAKPINYSFTAILAITAMTGCTTTSDKTALTAQSQSKIVVPACQPTNEQEIQGLFNRWNNSLATGDPNRVVANYAEKSILLPTVSNIPRYTAEQKVDYFQHFLENHPKGVINERMIQIGCNTAFDAGLYTFTFGKTGAVVKARYSYTYGWDGKQWLITSHHSSAMPEKDNSHH